MALMPAKRNAITYPRDVDVKLVRSMISQGDQSRKVSDCNFRNGGSARLGRSNPVGDVQTVHRFCGVLRPSISYTLSVEACVDIIIRAAQDRFQSLVE
jgi:hypothetical protein